MCDNPSMRAHHFVLSAALAALVVTGCGGLVDPSQNQNETFIGTVQVSVPGGAVSVGPVHSFNVSKQGEVTVHFTSMTPTSAAVLGAVFGQTVSGECAQLTVNNFSGLNRDPFSSLPIQQKGSYCIQMFDPGTLTVAQNYTVQVSHP
jgi:hypothetical protein